MPKEDLCTLSACSTCTHTHMHTSHAFLLPALQMHSPFSGLVLAPHVYPPSITWNPAENATVAARRWDLSWGLKMLGLDAMPDVGMQQRGSALLCLYCILSLVVCAGRIMRGWWWREGNAV